MLLTKTVKVKWGIRNKKMYESKDYIFTKFGDEFEVKVEDLTKGSHALVEVKCDGKNCNNIVTIKMSSYLRSVKQDGKHYCNICSKHIEKGYLTFEQWCIENNRKDVLDLWDYELNNCKPCDISFGVNKQYYFKCPKGLHKSELKNIGGITNSHSSNIVFCNQCNSLEQWCLDNNHQNILDCWDYELNDCEPNEIEYGSNKKYYFKCLRGIHESELKSIKNLTTKGIICKCNKCNSFAQWGIDTLGKDFLDKYWDYEKNDELGINPWEISKGNSSKKIWIRCQEKDYHGSYETVCTNFVKGCRCTYCSSKNIHPKDSIGQFIVDNFGTEFLQNIWSDKNKKSPYEYSANNGQEIWWKCNNEEHEDYKRRIDGSRRCDFRCPSCNFSKGESLIEKWLILNDIIYIPQKTFDGLLGIGGKNLSYDFYLPDYNLLIEYQGEFHDGTAYQQSKKDFKIQQEHDKRKKEYALDNKINLLEIWYYDFDKIEEILDNKISQKEGVKDLCQI